MNRVLSFILILVMAISLLAGCGSNGTENAKDASQPASSSPESTKAEEDDKTPITFTVFDQDQNMYDDGFQSDVAKKIQEETGVTLKIEYPVGDAEQKVSLIAASGEYPDMMYVTHQRDMLIKQGAFIKLDDLIEQYGSNIKKMFGENIKRLRYSLEDKSIYKLGTFGVGGDKKTPEAGFMIQWEVLKEAGYPKIKTLKEYEELIKQYKEKHPTIDGKPTIGLSLLADDWRFMISVRNPALLSTGRGDDGDWYVDPQTTKAMIHLRTPEEKEYFRWLNHMNDIGLLDKESFVQKYDQYLAKIGTGRVLAAADADWEVSTAGDTLKKAGKDERLFALLPLQMTENTQHMAMRDPGYTGAWGISITKSCKDPVRAMKFLDYLCSEKTQIMLSWGIEGKHYTVENGKRVLKPEVRKLKDTDNTTFQKTTGIDLYCARPWPFFGWGEKDSTGQMYSTDGKEQIINGYADAQREGLKAYGGEVETDLYPKRSELPKSTYGFAWQLDFPAESQSKMVMQKYNDLYKKRIPAAILCKPSEFDKVWDEFQKELIDIGIEKAEAEFTQIIQDRIKLWNE